MASVLSLSEMNNRDILAGNIRKPKLKDSLHDNQPVIFKTLKATKVFQMEAVRKTYIVSSSYFKEHYCDNW
jgi:hypothetical protein